MLLFTPTVSPPSDWRVDSELCILKHTLITQFVTWQTPFQLTVYYNCNSTVRHRNLMFIGPCIIVIVEEWKTNLMTLAILFHFLCAQHVSDINISIIRGLRLCWWITTSVVLFFRLQASACKTNTTQNQPHQKLQHTTNWEQDDQCGNSSTQSQAPDDGYINVRNMLSPQEVK